MQFRILGPLEICADDESLLTVTQGRHREIVTALLLLTNQPVTHATLVRMLWGDNAPRAAATTLRSHISTLRQLSPLFRRLETHRSGYLLRVAERELDVTEFRARSSAGWLAVQRGDHAGAVPLLRKALDTWREPPLADLPADPQLDQLAAHLAQERRVARQRWIDAKLALGDHEELISVIRDSTAEDPLNEHLWAQLVLALYRSGRQAEALDTFGQIRDVLAAECGIDPGRELVELQRRMLARDSALELPARLLSPGTPRPWPHEIVPDEPAADAEPAGSLELPAEDPAFRGRTAELDQVRDLLADNRDRVAIVAVTGRVGAGKTAFAVRLAHQLRAQYPGGCCFVSLTGSSPRPLSTADALAAVLLSTGLAELDLPESVAERAGLIKNRLARERILLVIDDAMDPASCELLLPVAPGSAVLITTRSASTVTSPTAVLQLTELSAAAAESTLLARLGRPVSPTAAIGELLDSCGRLPISVVLAATALNARPDWMAADLAELARTQRHRAVLAETGAGPDAAAAVAFAALGARAHRALRLLSEVTNGDVASWVAAAALGEHDADDVVAELVERGLLSRYPAVPGQPPRYWLPDFVRAQLRSMAAAEPSTDAFSARRRVLTGWLELADLADRAMPRPVGGLPSRRIARRTVLPETLALELVRDPVEWFAQETATLWAVILDAASSGDLVIAEQLVSYQLAFRYYQGDLDGAVAMCREIARLAEPSLDCAARARIRIQQAAVLFQQGDDLSARDALGDAISLSEVAGDPRTLALGQYLRSRDAAGAGHFYDARRHARRGLRLARRAHDEAAELLNVAMLAQAYVELGETQLGHLHSARTLTLAQQLQEASYQSLAATLLARVLAAS